ncbi:prolipoprotein diacylglyceryl transferase [Aquipuribacter hungaricus]|uniref:Phosphatidylglycerol--prolipoprotein diacylglyceryl transferase n=1 Tax=Aquipuribacter hungaricus TaxID=545624 RepID=A0ABV7WJM3_9MICO
MPTSLMLELAASPGIPSPSQGTWYVGIVPIRAYALFILAGIFVGGWLADRRWIARGGRPGTVVDVLTWAVPSGIVGARVFHVLTHLQDYTSPEDPLEFLRIWEGGLAIFGGLIGGALGAWYACRRRGIPLPAFADALAPGIAVGQAFGRWGNYFNQEIYGTPTTLPWGLRIDPENRPAAYPDAETFHPTFLYESLWSLTTAAVVIWADRRYRLGHGRAFALYLAMYGTARALLELLRTDEANLVLGLRVNQLVALLLVVAAAVYVMVSARLRPGREREVEPPDVDDPSVSTPTDGADGAPAPGTRGRAEAVPADPDDP